MYTMGTNTAKPYKIQESDGLRRIGITAVDMANLRKKADKLLNIDDDYFLCLQDGTEVTTEKYFQSLPPQTCFVFVSPEERSLEMDLSQVEKLTREISQKLSLRNIQAWEEVQKFLTGDNSEIVNRVLLDYINTLQLNIDQETREEDEAWFDGLPNKFRTKEAVMRAGAQSRIRNYYHKTNQYVDEQNVGENVSSLMEIFRQTLRSNEYHGDYFVRSAEKHRLCDELGWFMCQGAFNSEICEMKHSINPYGSKEARIVFSTWNLDHVIEKSREVFPTFVQAVEDCPKGFEVNWQYFYNLLFTTVNLKLVHIACHIKNVHVGKKCDRKEFYRKITKSRARKAKYVPDLTVKKKRRR